MSEQEAIYHEQIRVDGMEPEDKQPAIISDFFIYDLSGHVIALEDSNISSGGQIFISGRMFAATADPGMVTSFSVPVRGVGPIRSWFHLPELAPEGVETIFAETAIGLYRLADPKNTYRDLFRKTEDKVCLFSFSICV